MATLNGTNLIANILDSLGASLSELAKKALAARFDQMIAANIFSDIQISAVLLNNPVIRSAAVLQVDPSNPNPSEPGAIAVGTLLQTLQETVATVKEEIAATPEVPVDPVTPATTFLVTNDGGTVTFGGTATGDITFTLDGTVATFSRGGVTATTTADLATITKITVASGQTLSATAAQVTGKTIDGAGTVAVTALEDTLDADLSLITTSNLTAALLVDEDVMGYTYDTGNPQHGAHAFITGKLGTATVVISGLGTVAFNNATINEASFVLNYTPVVGTALILDGGYDLSGITVSGTGLVQLFLAEDTDLSNFDSTNLEVQAYVPNSVDISNNSTLQSKVDAYRWSNNEAVLTLTAEQAEGVFIAVRNVNVIGSDGDQIIDLRYATGTNTITPGAGADSVTLGNGTDTVVVKFGATAITGSAEVQTITPGTLTAGEVYTLKVGDATLTTAALGASPDVDALVAAIQAATGYTTAAYTVAKASNGTDIELTWKANGDITDVASLTASTTTTGTPVTASAANGSADFAGGDSDSTFANPDTITGFAIGTDKIDLLTVSDGAVAQPTGLTRVADVATCDTAGLAAQLATSFGGLAANVAGLVVISAGTAAGTYLYADNGNGNVDATADVFISLVGTTGTLGAVGALTVGDYFA